jgi:hypothetical protein
MGGQPRELDLYASSTGYNARPRRRGANCTYSVREPTAASPVEKRVQIDYVLISAAFRDLPDCVLESRLFEYPHTRATTRFGL